MSASGIYAGTVRHRRFIDRPREFSYPMALVLLDLAELPGLVDGRLLRRRPGAWRYRRRDFLAPHTQPLDVAVRDRVQTILGERPDGPIRMLTQLRCFGVGFNPVTFYYCFSGPEPRLHSVLAEVTNTPWRERHAYVLGPWGEGRVHRSTQAKVHHVSPFLGMNQRYEISVTEPGETLSVHISAEGAEGTEFDATLALSRRELTGATLSDLLREDPLAPLRTLSRIYIQGFTLKARGVPVHPHPRRGHA